MPSSSRFIPNPVGIAAVCAMPEMVAFFTFEGEKLSVAARDYAPVLSGEYRASIASDGGVRDGCAFGRAFSIDDKAVYIEFGTGAPGPTPAFQPFRRALDGYRVQ